MFKNDLTRKIKWKNRVEKEHISKKRRRKEFRSFHD
jgi:hypothetical protein